MDKDQRRAITVLASVLIELISQVSSFIGPVHAGELMEKLGELIKEIDSNEETA